ncbi:MAG TPA: DUF2294 domain-containing protein, partial [Candidatus Xenobia bacterium]
MSRLTKGSIEADVANAVVKFHREQQGRGPADVRVCLLGDLLVVRYFGVFTPTEAHLSKTEEGRKLIRSARQELRQIAREELEGLVASLVECKVLRSYFDLNVEAAEQIEVYV